MAMNLRNSIVYTNRSMTRLEKPLEQHSAYGCKKTGSGRRLKGKSIYIKILKQKDEF